MKKYGLLITVLPLFLLCCFSVSAKDTKTTVVDHVVYEMQHSDKDNTEYYNVVSLFDTKEAKESVKKIIIQKEINGIPVRSINTRHFEYGTEGEICWEPINRTRYIDVADSVCDTIVIPASVTTIGEIAFYKMPNLKTVKLQKGLTFIGAHAFDHCTSLQNISLPSTLHVLEHHAFSDCSSLEKMCVPNQITVLENCTFLNCNQLKSIRLNNRLYSISWGAFSGCENLTRISLPKSLQSFYQGAFFNTGITKLIVPETCDIFSFGGMTELKEIVFADRSGKFKLPAHCFSNLTALQQVELPKHAQTTVGQYAFAHCVKLTKIKNSKTIVKLAPKSFYRCKTLPAFTLSDRIQHIADNAFLNCKGLTKLRFTGSSASFLNHAGFLQTLPDTCKVYVKTEEMQQAFLDAGCKNKVIVKADLK